MRTPVIQSVMKSKDKNNDGRLDFQEFIGERGKDQDKVKYLVTHISTIYLSLKNLVYFVIVKVYLYFQEWLKSEKERFDTDLDENKDGTLDENEVNLYLVN